MENTSAPHIKKNYDFIDAIRGISMIGIVAEHSIFLDTGIYNPQDTLSITIFYTLIQFVKFGTICFFLLAGFLIGEKFTTTTALGYLNNRVKSTFLPWIFWTLFFLFEIVAKDVYLAFKFASGHLDPGYEYRFWDYVKMIYLYTSYWFIPNFLICIGVLLIFKRYLYSYYLGGVLLLFTMAYNVNIYNEWIEPRHSTAILGFVFFLWLGAQFNKNFTAIQTWLNKTPVYLWVMLVLLSLIAGVKEELYLKSLHSIDQYNSLRITNIIYSLSFFFLFLRLKKINFIDKLNPRQTTYGIYLIHFIVVYSVLPEIFFKLKDNANMLSLPQMLLYQLSRFVIVYIITFGLVKLINSTKFKWSIGTVK